MKKNKVNFYYEPFKIPVMDNFKCEYPIWEKVGRTWKEKPKSSVRGITYTPDFTSHNNIDDVIWMVETKGYLTPEAKIRWKIFKKWLTDNKKKWHIFMPYNKKQVDFTIQYIKTQIKNE